MSDWDEAETPMQKWEKKRLRLFVPEIDWLLVLLINRLKAYWTLDWASSIHADLYPTKNFSIQLNLS